MLVRNSLLVLVLLLLTAGKISAQQSDADLALQYASTGDYEKAVVYFEKWYNRDPYSSYPQYLACLTSLKDFEKAEKLVKKHIKKQPVNATLQVDLGGIYELQGKQSLADDTYRKAIKSLFPDIQQILNLGNKFIEIRKLDFAEQTFMQGRQLTDANYPFSFELADVYAQKQLPQKMVDEYLGVLEYNQQYLQNVQAILQNKIAFDLEGGLSQIIRTSLLRKIQKSSESTIYTELLYWLLLQEKDFESALIQAKALDKRNDENGSRLMALGNLCVSNQEYKTAEDCYTYILQKGKSNQNYIAARMQLIYSRDQQITISGNYNPEALKKLEADYETAITELGKNQITAPLISDYAHLKAFHLGKTEEAISLLEETIAMPGIAPQFSAKCKLELGDILILTGEMWDASLYYSQVDKDFKNDAIGREAKFKNARLSFYMGEFEWAGAQLNVLKAATSQLISNDAMSLGLLIMDNLGLDSITEPLLMYSRADLYEFCNRNDQSMATLDSILTQFPAHSLTDEIWFKQAGIQVKKGNFSAASKLYMDIVETYPDDILADDALYRLADLTENKLLDKEKAKTLYELLLTKFPGSLYAVDARKKFRMLRGDSQFQNNAPILQEKL